MSQRQAATHDVVFVEAPPPPLRVVGQEPRQKRPTRAKRDDGPRYVAPDSHRAHGTRVKYVVEKCRCEPCTAAAREANLARSRAIRRPDEVWLPYVPAGPARRHCHALMAAGVGPKSIAKLSGVPHGAISKLLYGDYKGRGPSKRIRPETERRILAVTVAQAGGAQKIPAGPTWALLDDLIARGFTKSWIARQLGAKAKVPTLQVSRVSVRASTARKVEALHRDLQGRQGPGRRSRWDAR